MDSETAPVIPTTMKNHFRQIAVLNLMRMKRINTAVVARKWTSKLSKG